jgi:hypothetical protein
MDRSRTSSRAFALLLAAGASLAASAQSTDSADNQYLDGLRGTWDMAGTVMGKPVRYRAFGERVLQNGFLHLHMVDAATPPRYEADVFLGFDDKSADYVVHWLDRFGAAGARVVGSGKRTGSTLLTVFPYADGAFCDTFAFDPKSGTWSLLIESQKRDGSWSTFAAYTLVHSAADQLRQREGRDSDR